MDGGTGPSPVSLHVLVIRNRVLLPGTYLRLAVGKPRSVRLVEELLKQRVDASGGPSQASLNTLVGVFALRPGLSEDSSRAHASSDGKTLPEAKDSSDQGDLKESVQDEEVSGRGLQEPPIFAVGCAARVLQIARAATQDQFQYSILVQGVQRIRVVRLNQKDPFYTAAVLPIHDIGSAEDPKIKALALNLKEATYELLKTLRGRTRTSFLPSATRDVTDSIASAPASALADVLVTHLNVSLEEKQAVLEEPRLERRLLKTLELIKEQVEIISISSKISSEVEGKLSSRQREYYLRQQLKTIREELGEDEDVNEEDEMAELCNRVRDTDLPADVRAAAEREVRRLKRMQSSQPEHAVIRNYLDWILDLPWHVKDEENYDVRGVETQLNKDHYGLEKVKKRILEFIAVKALNRSIKGPILCLVGPPGVGKTSLGRSVAQALGRKFHRLSLGGVHDEAEIRGHRRTYIGAMPGNIIHALKKAGTSNPLILLDEVDKLGTSVRGGDPSAALLEVLDPEQNNTFTDHYMNLPFDLSSVFFIATANTTDTIPEALLDRMEMIRLPGYTVEEKVHIAQRYLVPKQVEANGLTSDQLTITSGALYKLATGYTREAGVRQIEREVASICRHVAVKLARGEMDSAKPGLAVGAEMVGEILGPVKYESEVASRLAMPGVSTGMAWKTTGGELLFIECSTMPGKGNLIITGKLGDVMRESALIALSWLKGKALEVSRLVGPITTPLDSSMDVHIHVPAGAIPKDGPSAGVAIAVALVSLVTGHRVQPTVAMTGEITLRGLVLPVGGIKEKVLAAHRGGITHVILPHRNAKDLLDLPVDVRDGLKFTLVESLAEVLEQVLEPEACTAAAAEDPLAAAVQHAHPHPHPHPGPAMAHHHDSCGPVLRSSL